MEVGAGVLLLPASPFSSQTVAITVGFLSRFCPSQKIKYLFLLLQSHGD